MKFIAVLASLALGLGVLAQSAAVAVDATCPVVFGYSGFARPDQWKFISSQCGEGEQSPVRFSNGDITPGAGGPIAVNWGTVPVNVRNSGYDFRVNVEGTANTIVIDGETFVLQNFHFHRPAEHLVPGQPTAAEAHFVHKNSSDDIAVIAMFFHERQPTSAIWQPLLGALPVDLCDLAETGATIDLDALLGPPQRPRTLGRYLWYEGSLTTPPCAGDVEFYIVPVTFQLSAGDLAKLATFGNNNRPYMPLGNRKLFSVNLP